MSGVQIYGYCVAGVALSILIPILRKAIPQAGGHPQSAENWFVRLARAFWQAAKPYVIIFLFSLAVGVVVVVFGGNSLNDPGKAFLAGYAWDSTIQKIKGS